MSQLGGMTFPGSLFRDNSRFGYGAPPTETTVSNRVAGRVSQMAPSAPSVASAPTPPPAYYQGQEQKIKNAEGVARGQEFNRQWDSLPDDKKMAFAQGAPKYGYLKGDFGNGPVSPDGPVTSKNGVTVTPMSPVDQMGAARTNALNHFLTRGSLDVTAPSGLASTVAAMPPSAPSGSFPANGPIGGAMGPTASGSPQHMATVGELQNQLLNQKMQNAGVVPAPVAAPQAPGAAPVAPVVAPATPSLAPAPGAAAGGVPTPAELAGSRALGMTIDKYRSMAQEAAAVGVPPEMYVHLTPKEVDGFKRIQMLNASHEAIAAGNNQARAGIATGNNQTRSQIAAGNSETRSNIAAGNNQTRSQIAAGNVQAKAGEEKARLEQNQKQYEGKLTEQHAATEERIRHDLKIEGQKGQLTPDNIAKMKLEWDKENSRRATYKLPALSYPDYLSGGQKPTYTQTGSNDKGDKIGLNAQTNQWEAIVP